MHIARILPILCLVLAYIQYPHAAFAETEAKRTAANHLELQAGMHIVGGTVAHKPLGSEQSWVPRHTLQLFADRLYTLHTTESSHHVLIGPYASVGSYADTYKVAGGIELGYRIKRLELLAQFGMAYFGENLGAYTAYRYTHPGQTRGNYDLGLEGRWYLAKDPGCWYIGGRYNHNSNSTGNLGINFFKGHGSNPGIESITLVLGKEF